MAPKVIEDPDFKYREELPSDVIKKLLIDGGAEKVKEALAREWNYGPDEKVAVPVLVAGPDGKFSGAKWVITGMVEPKAVKAEQIWKEAEKDLFIEIKIQDLTCFPFYNRCRNVSGWLDSDSITWTVFKKEKGEKVVIAAEKFQESGIQKFSLRLAVLPNSVSGAALTLAIVPLSKDDLKKRIPDHYSKTICPQVALTLGEKTTRALNIKLGVEEPIGSKTGMKVWPLIEDLRAGEENGMNISSMDIRKGLAKFLRTVQGFNNKLPKTLSEAFDEVKKNAVAAVEPEWIWPAHHEVESDEPLVEQDELDDFDEEDIADLDYEDGMEDSLSVPHGNPNTTANLVNDLEREQGMRARMRSSSPEGSASDSSDSESIKTSRNELRKTKEGKVVKAKDNAIAQIAVEALVKLANAKRGKSKSKSCDSDDSDGGQDPIMIKMDNYKVRDDGVTKIDMKLRSALRTINAKPKRYYKHYSRKVKPALETLENEHLTNTMINPKIMKKLHDRGSYLELRFFDQNNISVETRAPKASFSAMSGSVVGTLSTDWSEPQTIWACMDAVMNYCVNLYGVRQEDYSPWVLVKALHEVRFFAACKSVNQQKKVLTDFVNSFFRKNEIMARKKEPPMDLKAALDLATASLTKAGIHHLSANIYAVEPYSGSKGAEMEEKDQEVKKLRVENAQLKRQVEALQRRLNQNPPRTGGYGGGQVGLGGGKAGGATKHPSQMTVQEKMAGTCRDWNAAGGCARKETYGFCFINGKKLKHGCSKVDGSRVCWDSSHKENEHV